MFRLPKCIRLSEQKIFAFSKQQFNFLLACLDLRVQTLNTWWKAKSQKFQIIASWWMCGCGGPPAQPNTLWHTFGKPFFILFCGDRNLSQTKILIVNLLIVHRGLENKLIKCYTVTTHL